ncbi:MAG: carboxypeptidase-like regulatory domain-containing protein, partial [Gammaproteobacteria bacterium]|nr:carboxypeptidase-like regulatory domain-containing protein [Gammaproteobacteria bacterium]
MKKWVILFISLVVSACGGGSDDGPNPSPGGTIIGKGVVTGLVTDSSSGARLKDVNVSIGSRSTRTDAKGEFVLDVATEGTVVIAYKLENYADGFSNVKLGDEAVAIVTSLKKEGARQNYDPSTSTTIWQTTEAGPYAVTFAPNTLDTTDTNLKVSVTPLDPTKEAQALPGELVTSGALLMPLTFAEFSIYDSKGNKVNLKEGGKAFVELPIPVEMRSAYKIGEVVHCYSYNPLTGQWEDFVVGTVALSSVDGTTLVINAEIKHFSWYGAAPESNDCVDVYGQVVSAVDGKPLAGAHVEAFPGTSATTDSNGNFTVRTTPSQANSISASKTYTDTDGSVSGMPGAKVIEFGKLADIPLVGLVPKPCSSPISYDPQDPGTTDPVTLVIGNIGTVSYQIAATILRLGGDGSDLIFADIEEILPTGDVNDAAVLPSATIVVTGPNGFNVTLTEYVSGNYSTSTTITPGGRYTITVDIDQNGSIDGSGSVFAVGDISWVMPENASTVKNDDLVVSWSDSGATNSDYAALYWVSLTEDSFSDSAYYFGSDSQFTPRSLLNPESPLAPGNYMGSIWAFSGPSDIPVGEFDFSNNVTG